MLIERNRINKKDSSRYVRRIGAIVVSFMVVVLGGCELLAEWGFLPETEYSLSVQTDGDGSVSVSPDLNAYTPGSSVLLTATPGDGWAFSYWSGDASGSQNPVAVTMSSSKTITAVFEQNTFELTVLTDGSGTVTKDPDNSSFASGEDVELLAAPDTGWSFGYWTGSASGTENPMTVTMDEAKTITAVFEENTQSLSVSTSGNGSVTTNPDQTEFTTGSSVELTATPAAGWSFSYWSGSASGSNNPLTVTMDEPKTITAVFIENGVNLTLSVSGSGSVSTSLDRATYESGATVTLTATADGGWSFSNWTGDASGSTNPLTITMDADKTISAIFTQDSYGLTVNATGSGSVSKTPDQGTYLSNTSVVLTATPDSGWTFNGWSGDASGSENPISVTMDSAKSVAAEFVLGDNVSGTIFIPYEAVGSEYVVVFATTPNGTNVVATETGTLGNGTTFTYEMSVPDGTYYMWVLVDNDGSGYDLTDGDYFAYYGAPNPSIPTSFPASANVTVPASGAVSYDLTLVVNSTYPLEYDANGATAGSVPASPGSFYEGETVTVSGNTGSLERLGHTFAGWNTAADGTGTSYAEGNTFSMPAASTTLYADWNELPPLSFSPSVHRSSDVIIASVQPGGSSQAAYIEVELTLRGFDFNGETIAVAGPNLYDSTGALRDLEFDVPEFVATADGNGNYVATVWLLPDEGIGSGRAYLQGDEDIMYTFVRAGTTDRVLLGEKDADEGIATANNFFFGDIYDGTSSMVLPGDRLEATISQFIGTFETIDFTTASGYLIRNQYVTNYATGQTYTEYEVSYDGGTTYLPVVHYTQTSVVDDIGDNVTHTVIDHPDNQLVYGPSVGYEYQTRVVVSSISITPGGGLQFDTEINEDPGSSATFEPSAHLIRVGTTNYF